MMMRWFLLCLLGVGAAHAADMTVLRYVDQDPGGEAYLTRLLVTPDYLRMDSGEDGGDFVLLDRRAQRAYTVMRDNKMAMVFTRVAVPLPPPSWNVKLLLEPEQPGKQAFSLRVNGLTCSEGVAQRGVAVDAVRAMAELKAALAATQYRVWRDSPVDLQHDCDVANQVWESDTTLKLGLPQFERDFSGRTRSLQGQTRARLKPELFRLPPGMAEMAAPGL